MNESEPNSIPTRTAAPMSLSAVTPTNPETVGDPAMAGPGTPPCVGEYVLRGELGRGGMGVVFRAEDPRLKREVALKVMLPQFAANPTAKARFVREARAQAKVEHDHVAAIHSVDEHDGLPYLVMPLLKGMTLQAALKANPRPPLNEVMRIGRETAEGLAAAHEKGLVHRDIKPANIWLEGKKLRVKVLDFGLARATDTDATEGSDGPVTNEGAVVGTPAYMSPEQGRGLAVDGRTDLFSLGVMLYQMTTGELPFRGATTLAILTSLALDNPPPPIAKNPAVPQPLSDFVMRLLAKDPAYRPPTAEAAAEELRAIEAGLVNAVRVIPLDAPPPLILGQVGPDPFADLDATEANSAPDDEPTASAEEQLDADVPAKQRGGVPVWALVGVVLLVVAGIVGAVVSQLGKKPPEVAKADPPQDPPVVVPPIVPKPPDPSNFDPSFFNGKDLTGWVGKTDTWRVENGELVGTPAVGVPTSITTERSYRDFELSFQVRVWNDPRLGAAHSSGLIFRADAATPTGTISGKRPAILLGDEKAGSLWRETGLVKGSDPAATSTRVNEFDDMTVRCVGRHVTVKVNGVKALDGEFDLPPEGRIGWYLKPGAPVRLRNIKFNDLSKPTTAATFFNGKDLAEWVAESPNWKVENGELVGVNPDKGFLSLKSARTYRDFELTFEARTRFHDPLAKENSAATSLSFRRKLPPDDYGSFEIGSLAGRIHRVKSGKWNDSLLAERPKAAYQADAFNSYSLKVVGQKITASVNGVPIEADNPELPLEGIFGWGLNPKCAELRVRNIVFRDLSGSAVAADGVLDRQVAEWVLARGGEVLLDDNKRATKPVDLPAGPFFVKRIEITKGPPLTAADGQRLSGLSRLSQLRLFEVEVAPEFLQPLVGLRWLHIIAVKSQSPQLFEAVLGLKKLRELAYTTTPLGDELGRLGELPHLISATFWGPYPRVTDQTLADWAKRPPPKLRQLTLIGAEITDAGMKHFAAIPHLGFLSLGRCNKITDTGAAALATCPALHSVEISGTQVTKDRASRVQEQLGWCQVNVYGDLLTALYDDAAYRKTLLDLAGRGYAIRVREPVTTLVAGQPWPEKGRAVYDIVPPKDHTAAEFQRIADSVKDLSSLRMGSGDIQFQPGAFDQVLRMRNLASLSAHLSDEEAARLTALTKLSTFSTSWATDARIASVAKLPHLGILGINGPVTDACLPVLQKATQLHQVQFGLGVKVTPAAVQAFANARPDVQVELGGKVILPERPVAADPERAAAEWLNQHADLALHGQAKRTLAGEPLPEGPLSISSIGIRQAAPTEARAQFFRVLADCPKLEGITDWFNRMQWTDADFALLATVPLKDTLDGLTMPSVDLTPASLDALAKLPLKGLVIQAAKADDALLSRIATDLPKLRSLTLKRVGFDAAPTAKAAAALSKLNLELLHFMEYKRIDKDWCREIAKITELRKLVLEGPLVDEAMLAEVAKCPKLKYLTILSSTPTLAGLETLRGCPTLIELNLKQCPSVTDDIAKKISAALPQCKITWDGGTHEPKK